MPLKIGLAPVPETTMLSNRSVGARIVRTPPMFTSEAVNSWSPEIAPVTYCASVAPMTSRIDSAALDASVAPADGDPVDATGATRSRVSPGWSDGCMIPSSPCSRPSTWPSSCRTTACKLMLGIRGAAGDVPTPAGRVEVDRHGRADGVAELHARQVVDRDRETGEVRIGPGSDPLGGRGCDDRIELGSCQRRRGPAAAGVRGGVCGRQQGRVGSRRLGRRRSGRAGRRVSQRSARRFRPLHPSREASQRRCRRRSRSSRRGRRRPSPSPS